MIVAVVRSRKKPDIQAQYQPVAARMSELACTMPGYVSHKGFVAEDGEQVVIVEFDSMEALDHWRTHAEHMEAKRRGYREFYSSFSFQICEVIRHKHWSDKGC